MSDKQQMNFEQDIRAADAANMHHQTPFNLSDRLFNSITQQNNLQGNTDINLKQLWQELWALLPYPAYSVASIFCISLLLGSLTASNLSPSSLGMLDTVLLLSGYGA